jgi:gluconate 5-dehydrogenase
MAGNRELFDLRGRLALVTGASRGIGRGIAEGLAGAGADIVAVARSAKRLEPTRRAVEAAGRKCHVATCDVAEPAAVSDLFAQLDARGLIPDILINNAGTEAVCASDRVDADLWDRVIDTNLKGAFFVAQHFAGPLLERGHTGSVINLGSLTSAVGVATAAPYTASKSGVLGLTRALSTEWAGKGIRVNAIGPGYFRTALTETFFDDEGWRQTMLARIPMGRFGQIDDLVGVSVFLASRASAYVSGQIFYVDGGYLAAL